MVWTNKATNRALRLCKQENNTHYEISPHINFKGLSLDIEDTKKGKRLSLTKVTPQDLLKRFPDLKEWEALLFAYDELVKLRSEKYKKENLRNLELNKAQIEFNKTPEGYRSQYLEGYINGLKTGEDL